MGYDPEKDKVLETLTIGDPSNYLEIRIAQYNGGEPKLRIGSRTIITFSGEEKHIKAGGLSREEVQQLYSKLENEWMEKYF